MWCSFKPWLPGFPDVKLFLLFGCFFSGCIVTAIHPLYAQTPAMTKPTDNNSLRHALMNGKIKALLRYSGQYRDTNLHLLQDSGSNTATSQKVQQYSALGGYLGYQTRPWHHFSTGATLYTSQPFGHNPPERKGLGGLYEADGGQDAYTVLGEAFIQFQNSHNLLRLGRQEMPDYRFVSLSDVRMSPITHQGLIYENTVFTHLQLNLAYIAKMKDRNAKTFIDMASGAKIRESAYGKPLIRGAYNPADYDDNGHYIGAGKPMFMGALVYRLQQNTLELWNYYLPDFVNTTYLYGSYQTNWYNNKLKIQAQYARQLDVGKHIAGSINTWFYGLKLQAERGSNQFFLSCNQVRYNEASYDGGTLFVRWGTPQMFNSFQVQDSELGGTRSCGFGWQYDLGKAKLLPGMSIRLRYGDYRMPDDFSQTDARQNRTETTLDINYSLSNYSLALKPLRIQFRLAWNNYQTDYDFDAYKALHGYNFTEVTQDFFDARLYFNYLF